MLMNRRHVFHIQYPSIYTYHLSILWAQLLSSCIGVGCFIVYRLNKALTTNNVLHSAKVGCLGSYQQCDAWLAASHARRGRGGDDATNGGHVNTVIVCLE